MTVGTKSVLYGAHQFILHPLFVTLAWLRLYGLRSERDPHVGPVSFFDPRLHLAFWLHDLGYIGKTNMDGATGEAHPLWAASLMRRWFGDGWFRFCLYHSRSWAKSQCEPHSLLCIADKLAVALEPRWLYLPRVRATGEIGEYVHRFLESRAGRGKYAGDEEGEQSRCVQHVTRVAAKLDVPPTLAMAVMAARSDSGKRFVRRIERAWHDSMTAFLRDWASEHKRKRADTSVPDRTHHWTPTIIERPNKRPNGQHLPMYDDADIPESLILGDHPGDEEPEDYDEADCQRVGYARTRPPFKTSLPTLEEQMRKLSSQSDLDITFCDENHADLDQLRAAVRAVAADGVLVVANPWLFKLLPGEDHTWLPFYVHLARKKAHVLTLGHGSSPAREMLKAHFTNQQIAQLLARDEKH